MLTCCVYWCISKLLQLIWHLQPLTTLETQQYSILLGTDGGDHAGDRGAWWAIDHGVVESVTTKQKYLHPRVIYISEEWISKLYGKTFDVLWQILITWLQRISSTFFSFFFSLTSLSLNRSFYCLYIYYFVSSHLGHPFIEPMACMTKSIS